MSAYIVLKDVYDGKGVVFKRGDVFTSASRMRLCLGRAQASRQWYLQPEDPEKPGTNILVPETCVTGRFVTAQDLWIVDDPHAKLDALALRRAGSDETLRIDTKELAKHAGVIVSQLPRKLVQLVLRRQADGSWYDVFASAAPPEQKATA